MWFEIYLDEAGKWRWRLCKANATAPKGREIIATSHQGHVDKAKCNIEVYNVKLLPAWTPVRYV